VAACETEEEDEEEAERGRLRSGGDEPERDALLIVVCGIVGHLQQLVGLAQAIPRAVIATVDLCRVAHTTVNTHRTHTRRERERENERDKGVPAALRYALTAAGMFFISMYSWPMRM
jgi:hypothetical protein